MAYPANTADLHAKMDALGGVSLTCHVSTLSPATVGGNDIRALEITGPGASPLRPVALIVAGQHAREWAPVDAVLSFAEKLLHAYDARGPMTYPAFVDGSVAYAKAEVRASEVQNFVNHLVLLFVPLANPDGRAHTRAAGGNPMWRGNRNTNPATNGCSHHGIDINRNYDIAWDTSLYYSAADEARITSGSNRTVQTTCVSGIDIYRGSAAGSENETQAIKNLIDARRPSLFMDVHSHGRWVLLPWGTALNQSNDPTKSFREAAWDRPAGSGRTVTDLSYREYVPNGTPDRLAARLNAMGSHLVDTIQAQAGPLQTARRRSTYRKVFIPFLYQYVFGLPRIAPVPGSVIDYAFGRQFKPGEPGPVYAFGLECGSTNDGENGFHPPPGVKYQKIEREVHAAIYAMLDAYVRTVLRAGVPIGPLP